MEYKSACRACDHKHFGCVCNWQTHKAGHIKLRPLYSEGLWGLTAGLHVHGTDDEGKATSAVFQQYLNTYKQESFEYEQETDCGCRFYVPSDNLEFVEWKYSQSE
jgi:hypothetical protein